MGGFPEPPKSLEAFQPRYKALKNHPAYTKQASPNIIFHWDESDVFQVTPPKPSYLPNIRTPHPPNIRTPTKPPGCWPPKKPTEVYNGLNVIHQAEGPHPRRWPRVDAWRWLQEWAQQEGLRPDGPEGVTWDGWWRCGWKDGGLGWFFGGVEVLGLWFLWFFSWSQGWFHSKKTWQTFVLWILQELKPTAWLLRSNIIMRCSF